MGLGHYFENKVEVIGFASPRIGKVLKFRGHEVSEEFENFTIPRACKKYYRPKLFGGKKYYRPKFFGGKKYYRSKLKIKGKELLKADCNRFCNLAF